MVVTCADRDRINPLDPENPVTNGRPTGLNVFSSRDTVFLSWAKIDLMDVSAIQIYRKADTETEFRRYQTVEPDSTNFEDTEVEFVVEYSYEITALGDDFESLPSQSVLVEPGPAFNWTVDNINRRLIKLTNDARHRILTTTGFFTIVDIEVEPTSGIVWVVDLISAVFGQVVRLSPSGEALLPLIDFQHPEDIELDYKTGSAWVADSLANSVVKLDSVGNELFTVLDFLNPIALAVDQRDGTCWVADDGLNSVSRISSDGESHITSTVEFGSVEWLAVDSGDGSLWVSDRDRVIKLDQSGDLLFEINRSFSHVDKLAVDSNSGDVWIIDLPNSLMKFDRSGEFQFELSDFAHPEDLEINLFDQTCLVADTEFDRIVRVSADGRTIQVGERLPLPIAVGIQNPIPE